LMAPFPPDVGLPCNDSPNKVYTMFTGAHVSLSLIRNMDTRHDSMFI
jgi:hypothetical protein